jgi:hypothetical protein
MSESKPQDQDEGKRNLLAQEEIKNLRTELYNLKECQIKFLTNAVTATGALLGLGTLVEKPAYTAVVFLFPLAILLPAWWVFFDKATSITRIVGYYRLLEGLTLGKITRIQFIGWENSLNEFRQQQIRRTNPNAAEACPVPEASPGARRAEKPAGENTSDRPASPPEFKDSSGAANVPSGKLPSKKWHTVFSFGTGHRYWIISYWTFFLLTMVCLASAFFITLRIIFAGASPWSMQTCVGLPVLFLVTVFVLRSAYYNAVVVFNLVYGPSSYEKNYATWRKLLKVDE